MQQSLIKKVKGITTAKYAKKVDLTNLKVDIKLTRYWWVKTVQTDLRKFSNVVINDYYITNDSNKQTKSRKKRFKMPIERYLMQVNLLQPKTLID